MRLRVTLGDPVKRGPGATPAVRHTLPLSIIATQRRRLPHPLASRRAVVHLQAEPLATFIAHVFMGVCLAFELSACAGKHLDSSDSAPVKALAPVSNEEASSQKFFPMEGTSAVLISPHRLLVTGGVLQDNRVLPFSVLRHLQLDPHSDHCHRWIKPTLLRPPSQRTSAAKKTRKSETAIPVCRMEQTLTMVPDTSKLYLIGGMKVGTKDKGSGCSTVFAFDFNTKTWHSIEPDKPTSRVKSEVQQQLGPRFAHSATYVALTPRCSSSRQKARAKRAPFIYVYGGYTHWDDHAPVPDVHIFDVKKCTWSLVHPASSNVEPPALAYHAASLTPCGKYIAIHGGNDSDFYDNQSISEHLFLFDVQNHKWLQPALHHNSDPPPRARRQHSLVQGVGRHEGSLAMYGGFVVNGTYSKEMFLCKVLEPEHPGERLEVFWESIDVQTTVARPVADDSHYLSEKLLSEKDAAISGGCLVALPQMRKYIMVGGRTGYGVRKAPLMLHPEESDEAAASQSMDTVQRMRALHIAVDRHAPVASKAAHAPVPTSPDSPQERCNGLNDTPSVPEVADEIEQSAGESASPIASAHEIPRLSSVQRTSSEKSLPPGVGTRGKASIGRLGSDRFRKRKPRSSNDESNSKPQKPGLLAVACDAVPPSIRAPDPDKENDPVQEADSLLLKSRRAGTRKAEAITGDVSHPLKKRRLRSDTKRAEEKQPGEENHIISPAPLVHDPIKEDDGVDGQDAVLQQSLSCRSEFIAPSTLKRAGRNLTAKGTKGGGRVSAIRQKQAELEASMNKNKDLEETIRRLECDMKSLADENTVLKVGNGQFKADNKELNVQIQKLLQEVQSLRNQLSAHDASDAGVDGASAPVRGGGASAATSVEVSGEEHIRALQGSAGVGGTEEVKKLRSKAEGLQEENTAINCEREAIMQELRESLAERREVERELNHTRNLLEQSRIECGKERTRANECEKELRECFDSGERAKNKLESAESDILVLKSKNETLNLSLLEERNKVCEVARERAASEKEIGRLHTQLCEQQKNFGNHNGKQRLLQVDLEAEKMRCEELNKLVDQNTEKVRKLEERCAQVVAERDTLHCKLTSRVREHEAALQVADKDKMSMDKLRRKLCDEGIENRRLKRELDVRTKECAKVKAKYVGVQVSLKKVLWPSIARLSKEFEEVTRECEAGDGSDGLVVWSEVVTGEERREQDDDNNNNNNNNNNNENGAAVAGGDGACGGERNDEQHGAGEGGDVGAGVKEVAPSDETDDDAGEA